MSKRKNDKAPFEFYFLTWNGEKDSFAYGWICQNAIEKELRVKIVSFHTKSGYYRHALVASSEPIDPVACAEYLKEVHFENHITRLDRCWLYVRYYLYKALRKVRLA